MKTLTRCVIAPVFLALFLIGPVAQPQSKRDKKTPSGQVSGSVTIRGKPAAGLEIRLRSNDITSTTDLPLKATTNEEGKYHIASIPPGTYRIAPIARGFVASEPNLENRNDKSFVIAEDENVENLDFSLVRGGVITGKVTDANGRPVIEETVDLMPADHARDDIRSIWFARQQPPTKPGTFCLATWARVNIDSSSNSPRSIGI
jgi:hypothetical protein